MSGWRNAWQVTPAFVRAYTPLIRSLRGRPPIRRTIPK